ncbi:MAG TPA: hypothetical protein VMF87_08515 [Streptosporangiaceae bacterium]|jgi:hypothetical protein|nr:hypothetical protein [Streptosporangiaceae bacterium]
MTEQTIVPASITAEPAPAPRRWSGAVFLLALIAGLAAVAFLVLVAAPSAGAAGGCGGG